MHHLLASIRLRSAFGRHGTTEEAVASCARQMGRHQPRMLLAFTGRRHDPDRAMTELRRVFGQVPIVGGPADGVIGVTGSGHAGREIGLLGIYDEALVPAVVRSPPLGGAAFGSGVALGRRIAAEAHPGACVLLLRASPDPMRTSWQETTASLLSGISAGLGTKKVVLVGASLPAGSCAAGGPGWVFDGAEASDDCAVACIFPPSLEARSYVMPGTRPVSRRLRVTSACGTELTRLDGRPALDVIGQHMPGQPLVGQILAESLADRQSPSQAQACVTREIIGTDDTRRSLFLNGDILREGTELQLMTADPAAITRGVLEGIRAANAFIGEQGSEVPLAFVVTDPCRMGERMEAPEDEASLLTDLLHPAILLGASAPEQIGPSRGRTGTHHGCSVLVILKMRQRGSLSHEPPRL